MSSEAEPLFRRSDGTASVVDLRVRSGKDFPASHSAYWELTPVWDAIATAFTWKRTEPLTVREAPGAPEMAASGSRHAVRASRYRPESALPVMTGAARQGGRAAAAIRPGHGRRWQTAAP